MKKEDPQSQYEIKRIATRLSRLFALNGSTDPVQATPPADDGRVPAARSA